MINIFAFGSFVTAFATGVFLLTSFFWREKNPNYGVLGIMNLPFFIWTLGFGLWQYSTSFDSSLVFLRLLMLGVCIMPPIFTYVVLFLAKRNELKYKVFFFFSFVISAFFSYLIYFGKSFFIGFYRIQYIEGLSFDYWPVASQQFSLLIIWFCITILFDLYLMIQRQMVSKGAEREQLKYYAMGTGISLVAGLSIILPWYRINFIPIGFFFLVAYPLSIFYAAARYRFMDISFVVGRGLIYLASIITVVAVAFILYGANGLVGNIVPLQFVWPIIMVVGIMAYPATFAFYEYLASKFFYYTIYEYQKVFSDLASKLSKVLDLAKLSELFMDTIMETMKLEKASLVLVSGSNFEVVSARGFDYPKIGAVVKSDFIISYAKKTLLPFSREELSMLANALRYSPSEQEKIIGAKILLEKIGVSLIVPMYMEDRLTGLLVLGDKISGAHFSEQDVETLRDLSLHAAVAFENARNYSMAQVAAKKLEEQVRLRTKELRATNEQLKKIDQEKSDFVALASYHLRTPLTVIKSYIASVISGEGGAVPEQMQRPLHIVQDSNENLIEFTNELLDVTRVESGTMEMKFEELDLAKMIGEIVGQLEQRAKEKGLELVFEQPSEPMPPIMADRLKIEQVVFNILDNAVKYTNKGSVIAKLEKRANKQVITVADTGEGMTHEEVLNIFEKFTRGESGPKSQTKGSGIGLYIAKKFIEMHKGKILGESRGQGLGSTFTIEIPSGKSK